MKKKLMVSLYDGCQYHCSFCMYEYVKETQPLSNKEIMSEQDWQDLFSAAYAQGFRVLNIAGRGEPTLNPAFVRILSRAHALGYDIDLLTNGLNDKAIIQSLPFLRKLKINLNAVTEHQLHLIHKPSPGFSFDRCITSVKNILRCVAEKNMDISLKSNYVVTTQSLDEAFSFPEKVHQLLAAELRGRRIHITYQHFHDYVKTADQDLGFDYEGIKRILSLAKVHSTRPFLLENTDLLAFIRHTETLIERLRPLAEKPIGKDFSNHTHYTCEAPQEVLFIDGNGDCYGCYAPFRAVNGLPLEQDPFFFGNLHAQGLAEVLSKTKGFNPLMDVSHKCWKPCLSCVAKGPVTSGKP